jgi:hypothetical protein
MGREPRDAIRKKVRGVLSTASDREFRDYLRWNSARSMMEFTSNPLEMPLDKRSAAWRRLQTAQRRLMERLKTGKAPAEQMKLSLDDE